MIQQNVGGGGGDASPDEAGVPSVKMKFVNHP